ncbi:hypothetical protein CGL52_11185 [Pyrobaculum aerophilum]|nr:hypothetical protein CGL52_11185 [Pyrobaculum aerophilum]
MPFPRARAVGGVLLGMGLLLYAGAMAGGYFAKPAMALANWTRAIAEWADLAPKPPVNASLASAFFYAEGGGMYFAKYNATLRMSRVYELWQEVVKAALPINISYYRLAFVNGSDYISGAGYARCGTETPPGLGLTGDTHTQYMPGWTCRGRPSGSRGSTTTARYTPLPAQTRLSS